MSIKLNPTPFDPEIEKKRYQTFMKRDGFGYVSPLDIEDVQYSKDRSEKTSSMKESEFRDNNNIKA